jgi:predicted nucleotidyltransferase
MKVSKALYHVQHIDEMSNCFIEKAGEKKNNEMIEIQVKDLFELLDYVSLYKAELLEKDISAFEFDKG